MSVAGRTVMIGGATSTSGFAAVRELTRAGAQVIAVGRDAQKLASLLSSHTQSHDGETSGSVRTEVCDLTDEASVARLAQRVHDADGAVDGVLHLVGGWRGGKGLAGQSEADFRFLEGSFTALRHVSRAFDSDLRASDAGRLAVVSSTAVTRPLAGGANYAAVKAATEAWTRAVAQGYAKDARDAERPLTAAAVIFRVQSLAGLEEELARCYGDLWNSPATQINDTTLDLSAPVSSTIGHK
ncbi:SDR family NAD(P)-dependent oxidoreductase [Demequina oxidasica]|uniref:SDR family NAD(P)-dependent oxidoreductase n=1 Tax=Demequina oxidasica TaxID=676199 RepID=UPI0007832565|nr:SDR family oxidoreductase [Demequina oxidasica]